MRHDWIQYDDGRLILLKAINRICGEVLEQHSPQIIEAIKARVEREIGCEFRVKHFRSVPTGLDAYLIETEREIVSFPSVDRSLTHSLTIAVSRD